MQKNTYICRLTLEVIPAHRKTRNDMRKYNAFRISCIALLWLFLCVLLIRTKGISGLILFEIAVSGIIVFVPLYKQWKKESKGK